MTEPVRMTDDDVLVLMTHGPDSEEGKAATKRLSRRMADSVDEHLMENLGPELYGVKADRRKG